MEIRNSTVLIIFLVALNHRQGHFSLLSLGFVQILLGCHACRFFLLILGSLEIGFGNLLLCIHDLCYLEFVLLFNLLHCFFSSDVCNCSSYLYYFLFELYFRERILLAWVAKEIIHKLEDWINSVLKVVLEILKFLILHRDSILTNYVSY